MNSDIMTAARTPTLEPIAELEMIRWRQSRFEQVTKIVEDALPALMQSIEDSVSSMSSVAAGKAQLFPGILWKSLFEPWARQTAELVEAQMHKEIEELAAASSEKGTLEDAWRAARPALAVAGVLGASLAIIPAVVGVATVSTTSFFVITTTTISWPLVAAGGAGLALFSMTGSKGAGWLDGQNRSKLIVRLQTRSRIAAMGQGLPLGERSLVTDLQAAVLRTLEAKLEAM